MVATETISSDSKESRLTVISAGSLIDQQITDAFSQLENTQVFMNAVTANFDGVTNLSIEAKSLTTEYNTVQHAGGFSILVVFVLAMKSVYSIRIFELLMERIKLKVLPKNGVDVELSVEAV